LRATTGGAIIHATLPRTAQDQFDEDDDVDRDDEPTLSERDDPDESDLDDDEGDDHAEAIPCPYCRKPVYEGAEICPELQQFHLL